MKLIHLRKLIIAACILLILISIDIGKEPLRVYLELEIGKIQHLQFNNDTTSIPEIMITSSIYYKLYKILNIIEYILYIIMAYFLFSFTYLNIKKKIDDEEDAETKK